MTHRRLFLGVLLVLCVVVTGCGTDAEEEHSIGGVPTPAEAAASCDDTADAAFPDVVAADVEAAGDGRITVSATLCSAYDTPERYGDAWRVLTPAGEVLGVRELLHDHANEQPFTRSLGEAIGVPDGISTVVVEGRDLVNGWGGATVEVELPDG